MSDKLFEHIDRARQYTGAPVPLTESEAATKAASSTTIALTAAQHLREAKLPEPEPIRLAAMPVPN